MVLGGGSGRYDYGTELYLQGLAPELWITGDNVVPPGSTSRAWQMARKAEQAGVPERAIHVLATTSTWEDGREVAALARSRGLHSLLVVTSWYHSRRALCVLRQHLEGSGVTIAYAAAPEAGDAPAGWWRDERQRKAVTEDLGKLAGYALRYGLNLGRCLEAPSANGS